ncbi:type II toxin-antitoxin system PemK/MazF family toxin [Azospirillum halopraeferens]|uniref:type II toxin-antitoxin system PemK/MazF family toxin n=1 Tax=Azospirillum halopraeferens TaxID=34010 RepID=UPI0004106B42|nr:type II toxin-antitoxin system PemK/MazF family toxin [Azospirillum halopraeferens]
MSYEPAAGDLIWTDFDPRVGREQSGRRPALVVSPVEFWKATGFAVVCPITSRVRPFGTSAVLPEGLPVAGEVLASHVRSIDTLARPIAFAGGAVPAALLAEVRGKLAAIMGM